MGGGKKQKAPAAPNYAALQESDALANRQTAYDITGWNRPTQIDQFGNKLSWSVDDSGNWTQSQNLNPAFLQGQEEALAAYRNSSSQLANQGQFNAPDILGHANLADRWNAAAGKADFVNDAGTIGNFDRTQGDQVAKDMYESSMSRLRPDQQRDTASMDLQLRQQGLQPGTEAYNRAMQNLTTSQGDVNSKLALDSTGAGYQAAQGIYNTNLGGQGQRFQQAQDTYTTNTDQDWKTFQGAAAYQQQAYDQALQNYSLPMERAQAAAQLYANAPGASWQGFSGATGYNPADMTGAANASYQAKMGASNASAGKKNSLMGTAGTLGAGYMMSDETLKENVVPIQGADALGVVLRLAGFEYDWKDGSGHDAGVIAQHLQKVLPDLVAVAATGKLCVNYAALTAILIEAVKYLAEANHGHH